MRTSAVLAGRERELAHLDMALDRLAAGTGSAVVLTGEPGIGKTRLLSELADRACERGLLVLSGRATEFERADPFAVFTDALDAHLAALGQRAGAVLPAGGQLDAVFPALAAATPSGPPDRLATQQAVRAVLTQVAERGPTVLILDDLHWADTASVDLFGYLVRHPPRGPVLLAAALRPAQCPSRLRLAVDTGMAQGELVTLPLGALGREEVALLLPDVAESAASELYAESGGNPFYLGALSRTPRPPLPSPTTRPDVPDMVLAALAAELRGVSPFAQRAAWGAAVAGDPFEVTLAAVGADMPEAAFLTALDELALAELIRSTDVPRRFRFRHPVVRRAVYEVSGPGWRAAAHSRLAAALAHRREPALVRAHHVEHSAATGDASAVTVLTEAGHAAAGHAPGAAAHWFSAALRLLPDSAEHGERRAELLAPLALAAGAAGQFELSRSAVDELLLLAPPEMVALRVELVAFRAFLDHVAGRQDEARALTERELRALPDGHVTERAALRIELAINSFVRSDYDSLQRHSRDALADATAAGQPPHQAVAGALVAFADYTFARIGSAEKALATAASLVDAMPDEVLTTRLDAALLLAHAEYNLEHHRDAVRHSSRGLTLAQASGQTLITPLLYVTRACGQALSGHLSDAIADAAAAYEVSALTGSRYAAALARGISSWVHLWTGELDTALLFADEAIRIGTDVDSVMATSNVGLFRAETLLESGRQRLVPAALAQAGGGMDLRLIERPSRARAYQVLVRAAIADADLAAARRWLAKAKADISGVPMPSRQADVLHAEASLRLAEWDFAAAATAALGALTAAEQGGVPIEAGRARILAGIAIAGAGDRARGLALLQRAERDLTALGAYRYRDLAVRELRKLGRRVSPASSARGPGTLSAREREIAELLAAGHTNRQIAARLVISEKTVETHVSRILGKLAVPSRAAVGNALTRE